MNNQNTHKAFNVGGLFPQKNRDAAKKAVQAVKEAQRERIMQITVIEGTKTTLKHIVKKIKNKKG